MQVVYIGCVRTVRLELKCLFSSNTFSDHLAGWPSMSQLQIVVVNSTKPNSFLFRSHKLHIRTQQQHVADC